MNVSYEARKLASRGMLVSERRDQRMPNALSRKVVVHFKTRFCEYELIKKR